MDETADSAYHAGYLEGHSDGSQEGFDRGYESGYDDGLKEGLSDGRSNGYKDGLIDGRAYADMKLLNLRQIAMELSSALDAVIDSMLLMGSTELHEKTRKKVYEALAAASETSEE